MPENSADHLRRSAQEPEAFGRFYDAHFEDLLGYLMRRSGDAHTALDLTAESFAQAFLSRRRFRGSTEHEAAAWLFTIGRRQLANYIRKGSADRRALERLKLERPELDSEGAQQVEELAEFQGLRSLLRAELDTLSPAHGEALRLRVVDELPYREVANRLGISEPAARARVSRALKSLADAFEQHRMAQEVLT